jgi:hypothetical protein
VIVFRRSSWVVALLLVCSGCSLAFPLEDYDNGTGTTGGGAGGSPMTTSSASTGTATSSTGVGGGGGAPPCGSGLYPPAASLVDTFDEGGVENFVGCGQQVGGELRIDLPDTGTLWCESSAQIPYCLSSSSLTVKVPEAATASIPGMQSWIILTQADGSGVLRLLVEGNGFGIMGDAGGQPFQVAIQNASYDPFSAAWWRLEGDGGAVVLSTSDGATWTERARGTVPLSLDGVFVALVGNRYVNPAVPESADLPAETLRFDCYNAFGNCP